MVPLASIKRTTRKFIDSFYNQNLNSKQEIGSADSWVVLTDKLKGATVISGGVGKDITFEIELASKFDCQVFLFDPSPTGVRTMTGLPLIPQNLHFFPIGLAKTDGMVSFEPPKNPDEGSFSISNLPNNTMSFECKKVSTLAAERGIHSFELIKIDIEGFEYEVIEDLIESRLKVRQIAVEFHDFMDGISRKKTKWCKQLLHKNGYTLFHKRGYDYSFVKK
jgi:FkbM family methyltransferase